MTRNALAPLDVRPTPAPLHHQLADVLREVTEGSAHSYEIAVHRLLDDMRDLCAQGQLDVMSYNAALSTAVDVLFFFNYDPITLAFEQNVWYRASLIHQIGHGMLQALEKFRPDLARKPFFCEAVASLSIRELLNTGPSLRCKRWADA